MRIIEQATIHDIDAVAGLDAKVLGSGVRADFLMKSIKQGEVWVARNGDVIAGFSVMSPSFFGQYFVDLLIVDPEFRRQGFGVMLMRKMEDICPTDKLFTSTNESNVKMQRLCASLGFTRSGYIENLDDGDPEIVYFKRVGRN